MAKPQRQLGPALVRRVEPEIQWRDYDLIKPGVYPAYCRSAQQYRDPEFKRWTCLLLFDVLSDDLMRVQARVPMWLNLGEDERPRAGRRSKFFKEWVCANGGPPRRRDRLSPEVFTRRIARVEVADTKGEAPYSKVRRIVCWETGRNSGVTQSSSHTVKEGMA
jgi:hypothetical protein